MIQRTASSRLRWPVALPSDSTAARWIREPVRRGADRRHRQGYSGRSLGVPRARSLPTADSVTIGELSNHRDGFLRRAPVRYCWCRKRRPRRSIRSTHSRRNTADGQPSVHNYGFIRGMRAETEALAIEGNTPNGVWRHGSDVQCVNKSGPDQTNPIGAGHAIGASEA